MTDQVMDNGRSSIETSNTNKDSHGSEVVIQDHFDALDYEYGDMNGDYQTNGLQYQFVPAENCNDALEIPRAMFSSNQKEEYEYDTVEFPEIQYASISESKPVFKKHDWQRENIEPQIEELTIETSPIIHKVELATSNHKYTSDISESDCHELETTTTGTNADDLHEVGILTETASTQFPCGKVFHYGKVEDTVDSVVVIHQTDKSALTDKDTTRKDNHQATLSGSLNDISGTSGDMYEEETILVQNVDMSRVLEDVSADLRRSSSCPMISAVPPHIHPPPRLHNSHSCHSKRRPRLRPPLAPPPTPPISPLAKTPPSTSFPAPSVCAPTPVPRICMWSDDPYPYALQGSNNKPSVEKEESVRFTLLPKDKEVPVQIDGRNTVPVQRNNLSSSAEDTNPPLADVISENLQTDITQSCHDIPVPLPRRGTNLRKTPSGRWNRSRPPLPPPPIPLRPPESPPTSTLINNPPSRFCEAFPAGMSLPTNTAPRGVLWSDDTIPNTSMTPAAVDPNDHEEDISGTVPLMLADQSLVNVKTAYMTCASGNDIQDEMYSMVEVSRPDEDVFPQANYQTINGAEESVYLTLLPEPAPVEPDDKAARDTRRSVERKNTDPSMKTGISEELYADLTRSLSCPAIPARPSHTLLPQQEGSILHKTASGRWRRRPRPPLPFPPPVPLPSSRSRPSGSGPPPKPPRISKATRSRTLTSPDDTYPEESSCNMPVEHEATSATVFGNEAKEKSMIDRALSLDQQDCHELSDPESLDTNWSYMEDSFEEIDYPEEGASLPPCPAGDRAAQSVHELMRTEVSYVRRLEILVQARDLATRVLGPVQSRDMFRNLDSIARLHRDVFLPQLTERMHNWENVRRVGDIMRGLTPFLKMYTDYVNNFNRATDDVNIAKAKNSEFRKGLYKAQAQSRWPHLDLKAHMLEPVQRVPRYELLLKDYIKHLAHDSEDTDDVKQAIIKLREVAKYFENIMAKNSKMSALISLQKSLDGAVNVVHPSRELLRQGRILKVNAKTGKVTQCQAFLMKTMAFCANKEDFGAFEDVELLEFVQRMEEEGKESVLSTGSVVEDFLVASEAGQEKMSDQFLLCEDIPGAGLSKGNSPRYKVMQLLDLDGLQVQPGINLQISNSFLLRTKSTSLELCTSTADEKDEWQQALWKAIMCLAPTRDGSPNRESHGADTLGHNAPVLVHFSQVSSCMICTSEFKAFLRKHHCKACGNVVCHKCSPQSLTLQYAPRKPLRVCRPCHQRLLLTVRYNSRDNQVQVSACDPKALLSDNLFIRGKLIPAWKRRWLVLRPDGKLLCFKTDKDNTPLTSFDLGSHVAKRCDVDGETVISLALDQRTYYMKSTSLETMARWLTELQRGTEQAAS